MIPKGTPQKIVPDHNPSHFTVYMWTTGYSFFETLSSVEANTSIISFLPSISPLRIKHSGSEMITAMLSQDNIIIEPFPLPLAQLS